MPGRKFHKSGIKRHLVAVIDDHKLFLDGLSMVVASLSETYQVERYETPAELICEIENGKAFSLVICDLIMQPMNGLSVLATLKDLQPGLPTLIVSGLATAPPLEHVKRLGGAGFIHKSADADELSLAIKTVIKGGTYFMSALEVGLDLSPPEEASGSPAKQTKARPARALPVLSRRQIEVLRLIASGAANRDIASALSISENTVKTHIKALFSELGVNRRTACVSEAQKFGLI